MKIWALLLVAAAVSAKHEQYEGWKSYSIKPSLPEQVKALPRMVPELELDFLSYAVVNRTAVVLVKPQYQKKFLEALVSLNIDYKIHAENVKQKLDIDDQRIEAKKRMNRARNGRSLPYDNYPSLEDIYEYLDEIAANYPEKVTLVEVGPSFEGRPIKYLKISTTNFEDPRKPVIFIDAGVNSHEWIAPPTVIYAIHKLVENVTEPDLLENYDWILHPMVNPDGYKFSHEVERLWRKTRSTDQHSISWICIGVDITCNFDYVWNTVGTSTSPCANNYPGASPFSEVETRVVAGILNTYANRISLYLTMRSYSSMILYPWGNDGTFSQHAFALQSVGMSMAQAIREKSLPGFERYLVGNSALVSLNEVSGRSDDYAHSRGIPLTYTFELPGLEGDELDAGFHLDPKYILQICEETWAGIAMGARRSAEMFGK